MPARAVRRARVGGAGVAVPALGVGAALGRQRALVEGEQVAPPDPVLRRALRLGIVREAGVVVHARRVVGLVGRHAGRVVTVAGAAAAQDQGPAGLAGRGVDHDRVVGAGALAVGADAGRVVVAQGARIGPTGREQHGRRGHHHLHHHLHRIPSLAHQRGMRTWPHCGALKRPAAGRHAPFRMEPDERGNPRCP